MLETMVATEDYLAMGLPSIWVLDPWEKRASIVDRASGFGEGTGQIATGDRRVVLTLAEIFANERVS
jgi:hypothetical protein